MTKRRTVYNHRIPWGLYFSEDDTGMPSEWTNVTLDLTGIAAGVAHLSDQYDITTKYGLVSDWWRWRASFKFQSATVVGELMRLFVCGADDSDNTAVDGDVGVSATATVTEADLANCDNFGNIDTTQTDVSTQSGVVRILDRYVSLAIKNETAAETTTTAAGDSWIKMWPVPEIGN